MYAVSVERWAIPEQENPQQDNFSQASIVTGAIEEAASSGCCQGDKMLRMIDQVLYAVA